MKTYVLLLYGYDRDDVEYLNMELSEAMSAEFKMLNATGHLSDKIEDVLQAVDLQGYAERDFKFCMFIDCQNREIEALVASFPPAEDLDQPIFCVPTKKNIYLTVEEYIADLQKDKEGQTNA